MLQDALELRADSQWLQFLATLRLPSLCELRLMSMSKLQSSFGVSWQIAALLADFANPSAPCLPPPMPLPSIPEGPGQSHGKSVPGNVFMRRRRRSVRGSVLRDAPVVTNCYSYEVDHVREPSAKDCRYFAGLKRARNTRCDSTQLMIVVDGLGAFHHLSLHAVHTMPCSVQRRAVERKWPSKTGLRRERAWERDKKARDREEFLMMA